MKRLYAFVHGSFWETTQMVAICFSVMFFGLKGSLSGSFSEMIFGADMIVLLLFGLDFVFRLLLTQNIKKSLTDGFLWLDILVFLGYFFDYTAFGGVWGGFVALRALKLISLFRHITLTRSFFNAFAGYAEEFILFGFSFLIVLTMGSFGMFRLEGAVNPNFNSLGDCLWWSVVTMSTVGYGDAVPITTGGKFLSGIVMILGLATMAMLTGMITKVFFDHFFGKKREMCPRCRFPHHDFDARFCKNCGEGL